MAPPKASKNFRQTQPITTTLRNICESYPPDTCLRELLQNADDAGASEVEYVLDTQTYPHSSLLHPELAQDHGPALLIRNNSIFSDRDLGSLSSVGDSIKRNDPATTGKFGQGFNSVYNWTDGPWLYSRNWLLMLDPHEGWSRESHDPEPGGPTFDVVENHSNEVLQSHLATFSACKVGPDPYLNETIIRLPLRTKAQAERSKISSQEATTDTVQSALKDFSEDIEQGGLLFLRNVRRIFMRVDDTKLLDAQIDDEPASKSIRDGLPQDFLDQFGTGNAGPNSLSIVRRSFQTNIRFENGQDSWMDSYLMQHMFKPLTDVTQLESWARERKLFPWVAIAAPLRVREGPFKGQLFSTLSLHIDTQQPVHIHGLFAIAPDRSRLGRHEMDIQWNNYIFGSCVAAGWADLISQQSSASPTNSSFSSWPRCDITHKMHDIWTSLDDLVLDLIIRNNSEVWQSTNGERVSFEQALFVSDDSEDQSYRKAWEVIGLPGVILAPALFRATHLRAKACEKSPKVLKPSSARLHLRDQKLELGDHAALVLEFCLLDAIRDQSSSKEIAEDLYDLRIWPMLDGSIKAINRLTTILLPRSLPELDLFRLSRASSTISLRRLSPQVSNIMKERIIFTDALVRFRELDDLEIDWPALYQTERIAGHLPDVSQRATNQDHQLRDLWTWMIDRLIEQSERIPASVNDLWLLPIKGTCIRRLASKRRESMVLILDDGSFLQGLFNDLPNQAESSRLPLLETSALSTTSVEYLKRMAVQGPDLGIATYESLDSFTYWLLINKTLLSHFSEAQMVLLLRHIEGLLRTQKSTRDPTTLGTAPRQLPLYNGSHSETPYRSRLTTRCEIPQDGKAYFLPPALPAFPDLPGLKFFDIKEQSERYIVQELGLVSSASVDVLLNDHILPWMTKPKSGDEHFAKMQLLDWIFGRIEAPDARIRNLVSKCPIIPINPRSHLQHFRCLIDLVDPRSESAVLYFEDEPVFPANDFFEKHELALRSYGIQRGNESPTLPLDRARVYAKRKADARLLAKVQKLLTSALAPTQTYQVNEAVQNLSWLPARMPDGEIRLCSPKACGGLDQRELIDEVWGWLPFNPLPEWTSLLGWDVDVPGEVLMAQVDACITKRDTSKLSKAMRKVLPQDYSRLMQKSCIQGQHGELMMPSQVFYPGHRLSASSLLPYIDSVDGRFAKNHKSMLSFLGVAKEPSLTDIEKLQVTLGSTCPLDASGVSLAIRSLEVALRLPDFDRAKLAIPDTLGIMRSLTEIVHGEPVVDGQLAEFHYTNARVSNDLIQRLKLESCYERAIRLDIEIEDEEDDEYTQREDPKETILDTLGRYPIDATFSEFLANADDAGAKEICWTLDDGSQDRPPSESSLTAELKRLDGPSTIVYNDATFSEEDFLGFKRFGQGGKKGDATTTGMFGKGGMTMYHFTDVPMLLSAGYLIILDPQQTSLPRNKHMVRKRGQKLSLQKARKLAGAQLALFEGMHGFSAGMDHYEGTMFRFPLRKPGVRTKFNRYSQHVDLPQVSSLLAAYMSTARQSLLFMPNVRSIGVRMQGVKSHSWHVSIHRADEWEHETFNSAIVSVAQSDEKPSYDLWRIGLKDVEMCPADIRKVGKSVSKVTECGVAACIQSAQSVSPGLHGKYMETAHSARASAPQHKVHCKLPLSLQSQLPITFHASFAITGDRKTIPIEGQDDLSAWNRWLLTECVANFYIDFLVDAVPKYGAETFNLWPNKSKLKKEVSSLSCALADSFWSKIGQDSHQRHPIYPLVCNEPSFAEEGLNDLRRPKKRTVRVTHRAAALGDAQFDFLSKSDSRELRHLFGRLAMNIVRPPESLRYSIKAATKSQDPEEVGPRILSQIFKEESNVLILEKHLAGLTDKQAKATFFAALLNNLVPRYDDQNPAALHILEGCRIIPRADLNSPLGTLRFNQPQAVDFHLVASLTERTLFPVAADHFANHELLTPIFMFSHNDSKQRNYLHEFLQSGANIRLIDIGDLGFLFETQWPDNGSEILIGDHGEWMTTLWQYLNLKLQKFVPEGLADTVQTIAKEFLTKANLWNKPIYRLCSNESGNMDFISPAKFESGPFIVEPSDQAQHQLCAEIPILYSVDPAFMPSSLAKSEENLATCPSFERFLKALKLFSANASIDVTLDPILSGNSRQVLMDIMFRYVQSHSGPGLIRDSALLRRLPVWPRASPCHGQPEPKFIALSNARVCEHSDLFVTWMKNKDTFIEPGTVACYKHEIEMLGVKPFNAISVWNQIKSALPTKLLDTPARREHSRLLRTLCESKVKVTHERVAPNGHGILCKPSDLYNHTTEMFWQAFQFEQEDHFVHPDLRIKHVGQLFFKNGLRDMQSDTFVREEDFLECALAIARAFQNAVPWEAYESAASPAANYLQYEIEDFHNWASHNWQRISEIPLFRIRQRFENQPVYRQSRMQELVGDERYCSLVEAARLADIRIIWSQYKILENPPADFVFNQRQTGGRPSLPDVYEHLKYLASFYGDVQPDETSQYLKDVQACYDYMQKHAKDVRLLPNIRNERVWFNLDSTATETIAKEQLTGKLLPVRLLCLDAPCDTALMIRARKFLAPYESLLRSLECPAFAQPQRPAPRASLGGKPVPLGNAMHELRNQGLLVDICFSAEGVNVQAHKIVLAAVSDYCKTQFSGNWTLSETPIQFAYGCGKLSTLSVLIDSAYGVAYQGPVLRNVEDIDEIANTLDEILDALVCANAWQMDELRNQVEDFLIDKAEIYRRADNVEELKKIATEANASRLVGDCNKYTELNKDALERLNRA